MATLSSRDDPLPYHEICRSLPDRCVGYARTMGRRCRNPVGMHKYPEANRLISRISTTNDRQGILDLLYRLAEMLLCSRWHQDQAQAIARTWLRDIDDSPPTRPATSQAPTSMTSTSSSQSVAGASADRENSNLATASRSTQQRGTSLLSNVRPATNHNREVDQQATEHDSLIRNLVSTLRRDLRSASRENEGLREQVNEIDELRDTATLLRAQIVDLAGSLGDARTELATARDETSQLNLSLESEREEIRALHSERTNLQLQCEEEREAKLDAQAERGDLRNKLQSESEAKNTIKREKDEVEELLVSERRLRLTAENYNAELKKRISDLNCQLVEQKTKEEARTVEIEARRARWDKYNADWIRFNMVFGPRDSRVRCCSRFKKSLLTRTQGQDNTQDDIREQIPWPTQSGDIADACADSVSIFLLNHVPGLVGVANPDTLATAVSHLEYEVNRWNALWLLVPSTRLSYSERTRDLLWGILGTVCEVLLDTQRQLRVQMDAPLDLATTQSSM